MSENRVQTEKVPTPEWGDPDSFVHVRGLTAGEYEKCSSPAWRRARARPARDARADEGLDRSSGDLGTCDENGEPVFSEQDRAELQTMNNRALNRVALAIQKLSGIGDEEEVVNEFEGNSSPPRAPALTSAWSGTSEE